MARPTPIVITKSRNDTSGFDSLGNTLLALSQKKEKERDLASNAEQLLRLLGQQTTNPAIPAQVTPAPGEGGGVVNMPSVPESPLFTQKQLLSLGKFAETPVGQEAFKNLLKPKEPKVPTTLEAVRAGQVARGEKTLGEASFEELSPRDKAFQRLTPAEQKQVLLKPGTTVNVGGEKGFKEARDIEAGKAVAKLDARTLDEYRKDVRGATENLQNLSKVEAILPRVKTGAFTGFRTQAANVARSFGFNIDPQLDDAQVLNALVSELALRLRNPKSGLGLTGNTSEKDLAFLREAVISLEKTTGANRKILKLAQSVQRRRIQVARMAERYFRKNRGFGPGFDAKMAKFAETNPLSTELNKVVGNTTRTKPVEDLTEAELDAEIKILREKLNGK